MHEIQSNFSLRNHNTFGIEARTRYFATFAHVGELQSLLQAYPHVPHLFLGEGSNILFTQDFEGLVLCNHIKGIEVIAQDAQSVTLRVGAGERWHQFVLYCLENGYYGLENLSLIPGTVGASPMQNIGAYGVEVKKYITCVHAYHLPTGELHSISKEDCAFDYRSSIFKTTAKGQYCITSVEFALPTVPNLQLAYGDIQKTLEGWHIASPTPQDVSRAVVHIRQSKLPNPAEIGNAGSFFKNPEIPKTQWEALQMRFPSLPSYPTAQADMVKIPAGWLIEQAGWKGYRLGDAGVHAKQALVLVNYGEATGKQIWQLAQDIQQDVLEKFGIKLSAEVNLV